MYVVNVCGICFSSCVSTQHLPDAAAGVHKTQEYKAVVKETKAFIDDVDKALRMRKAHLARIAKEKHQVKKTISDFCKQATKYLIGLETKSLNDLDMSEKIIADGIDEDVNYLERTMTMTGDFVKQLESFKGDNECQHFVHIKVGKLMLNDAMYKLADMSQEANKEYIGFKINPKIEVFFDSFDMLGTFSNVQMAAPTLVSSHVMPDTLPRSPDTQSDTERSNSYVANLFGEFDVKEKSDSYICSIYDICQLPNGRVIVTDFNNDKLKRLDPEYILLDSVQLPSTPGGVCVISPDEVAVSLSTAKKIQIVSVGAELTLTRSFPVGNNCRGIVYMDGKLHVCCGAVYESDTGCIEVYNNSGQLQHYIAHSQQRLATVPMCITASDDCLHLLVICYDSNDIHMLDMAGNVVNTFNGKDCESPDGMCTDGRGNVFVCGYNSNTVLQLSPGQHNIEVILRETDEIKYPWAVYYDRKTSRLVVACYLRNEILVYELK